LLMSFIAAPRAYNYPTPKTGSPMGPLRPILANP